MNSNQFDDQFNAITNSGNYGLSPIYDELVNEGYFNYSSFAEGIYDLCSDKHIRVISELCIGSGNAMKEIIDRFGDNITYQGIDLDTDMLNKCKFNLGGKEIKLLKGDISKAALPQKSDVIFSHSADPMIFWEDEGYISLALNSSTQFKEILLNVFHNLNKQGIFIINIEQRGKEFPDRFDVEILREQSKVKSRIIYTIIDSKDNEKYFLALEKIPELDMKSVNEIVKETGFIDFKIDKYNRFVVFKK